MKVLNRDALFFFSSIEKIESFLTQGFGKIQKSGDKVVNKLPIISALNLKYDIFGHQLLFSKRVQIIWH